MAILVVGRQSFDLPTSTGSDLMGPTFASLDEGGDETVYVQFTLDAPGAASVAVTGDFDGWEGSHGLEDLNGDGVWSGRVPVRPGVHAYMFIVDGSTWMTDPRAERYAEDGFGNRNAILAVATPTV
jgi:1,4-alpha-glucan branching enzyme